MYCCPVACPRGGSSALSAITVLWRGLNCLCAADMGPLSTGTQQGWRETQSNNGDAEMSTNVQCENWYAIQGRRQTCINWCSDCSDDWKWSFSSDCEKLSCSRKPSASLWGSPHSRYKSNKNNNKYTPAVFQNYSCSRAWGIANTESAAATAIPLSKEDAHNCTCKSGILLASCIAGVTMLSASWEQEKTKQYRCQLGSKRSVPSILSAMRTPCTCFYFQYLAIS